MFNLINELLLLDNIIFVFFIFHFSFKIIFILFYKIYYLKITGKIYKIINHTLCFNIKIITYQYCDM